MGAASCASHAAASAVRVILFAVTLAAAGFYFRQRALHTLEVEWYGYGVFVLATEVLSAASALASAFTLIVSTRAASDGSDAPQSGVGNRVLRVLVHATSASAGSMQKTVESLKDGATPPNCQKVVYVLDDAGDYEKQNWVEQQPGGDGTSVEYVSRDIGPVEFNSRARSFNRVIAGVYGLTHKVNVPNITEDNRDVVFVVDAGQICDDSFFNAKLAALEKASLVLSPQALPGASHVASALSRRLRTSGMGSAFCGQPTTSLRTNFAVGLQTLRKVDLFDKTVPAEDYALMAELAKRGDSVTYLDEPLATSECAPTVTQVFAERTNWALSLVLVLFGRRNPITRSSFPIGEKLIYFGAAFAQLISMALVPVFLVIPALAVWLGIMPAVLNYEFLKGFILFYPLLAILMYVPWVPSAGLQIWTATMADQVFWFAFVRGAMQAMMRKMSCHDDFTETVDTVVEAIRKCNEEEMEAQNGAQDANTPAEGPYLIRIGETTPSGGGPSSSSEIAGVQSGASFSEEVRSEGSIFSPNDSTPKKKHVKQPCVYPELIIAGISFLFAIATMVAGIIMLIQRPEPNSKSVFILCIGWCIYNALPPLIALVYAVTRTKGMGVVAVLSALLSIISLGLVIVGLYFRHYEVHDYKNAISDSLLFYEAQRSGPLPEDNRIPWRGDSGLLDRTTAGEDLVGGYYDGLDTMKHGFPMATATSLLAWGLVEFPNGFKEERENMEAAIRWGTDYYMKAHTAPDELYVLVNSVAMPGRPRDVLSGRIRVGKKLTPIAPGSDVAGATAAALASAAVVFQQSDPDYSKKLLEHARDLYIFARDVRGVYSNVIDTEAYKSNSVEDDLAWAAIWLYLATDENRFIEEAQIHMAPVDEDNHIFDYDNVGPAACVLLAKLTKSDEYKDCTEAHIDYWMDDVPVTPSRLAWGGENPLPRVSNMALVALVYNKHMHGEGVKKSKLGGYQCWAMTQIGYSLGDGGKSFMVGWDDESPTQPLHQGASCPDEPATCSASNLASPLANPQELTGALVSGPDEDDGFEDSRQNAAQSRVSLMNNAGFTSALGALASDTDFSKCFHGLGVFKWLKVVDT